jgi:hypothetical protein
MFINRAMLVAWGVCDRGLSLMDEHFPNGGDYNIMKPLLEAAGFVKMSAWLAQKAAGGIPVFACPTCGGPD